MCGHALTIINIIIKFDRTIENRISNAPHAPRRLDVPRPVSSSLKAGAVKYSSMYHGSGYVYQCMVMYTSVYVAVLTGSGVGGRLLIGSLYPCPGLWSLGIYSSSSST